MKKQVPRKNYVVLAVVVALTVLAVFYARNWYIMAKEYNSDNSPILKAISEINPDEINNYTLENPKFILYTSSGLNPNIKGFESKFKNYVIDKNLSSNMIYVNTENINLNEFNNELKEYAINDSLKTQINSDENVDMYIFENSKIIHVIENANKLEIKQIDTLFKSYGMLDNA